MVCIHHGVTTALSGGHYVVGSLVDGGTTIITRGSLLIANPKVVSEFAVMQVVHGQLTWAGIVDADTLDARDRSVVTSGTQTGTTPQRRLLPCIPGYTPLTNDSYCGPRYDKPLDPATLRRTWLEFVQAVNIAAASPMAAEGFQHVIANELTTPGCASSRLGSPGASERVSATCRATIARIVADAARKPLGARLTDLTISKDSASARARGTRRIDFALTARGWLISNVRESG